MTIPYTFAASHVSDTDHEAGAAANDAAYSKNIKYAEITRDFIFTPIAVETTGAWNKSSMNFISELGKKISEVTTEKLETSYLFQRLSIAIQRGNAICILGTLASD